MSEELKDFERKYTLLENKLNETIKMTNQLIINVNASNQFICDIHNALASAGFIKSPDEIKKDIASGNIPEEAKKLLINPQIEPEPEPELETAD